MLLVSHLRIRTSLLALIVALGCAWPSLGQKPEVKGVDVVSGPMGSVVTITGDNFGADASQLQVQFGAAKGSIQSASNQVLEVKVPEGTTYDNISVTNLTSGLSGYTRPQFLLSYGGTSPFLTSSLQGQYDFDAESGLYDICLCDFDADGKVDVGTAGNKATSVRILRNTSTGAGNVNFATAATLTPGTKTLRIRCGDLDGDGKPDIVLTEDGDGHRVFLYRNTSTGPGNFTFSGQSINIGKKSTTPAIADLDGDGKPEVIISNQDANTITVLKNQSTPGNIAVASTPYTITISGAATTDGLAVNDLNGDGRPEIVTGQYQTNFSNLFIVANNSTPGTLSLTSVTTISLPASVKNIRIGDLDGDRKPDIAATLLLSSSIAVLHNTSNGTTMSFAAPKSFVTVGIPVGLDFGDLDGDGKTDISVVSINNKQMTVLNNTSTPGNINFTSSNLNITYISRHVKIGDVDGDGKPDIVFASVDDDNNAVVASKVSVLRNSNCLIPVIEPAGPLNICSDAVPYRLYATASRGVTYEWRNESTNTVIASGPNPYADITVSGKYSVTAIAEGGSCSKKSDIIEVTVSAGTFSGTPVASNNGPLCVGSPLYLQVNDVGATEYRWYGPAGYTATGRTPPPLTNFQPENIGRYYVDIVIGSCVATTVSTVVEAIDIGSFQVTYPGNDVICQGDTKTLTVSPVLAGTTYQWYESGTGLLSGETNPTLTVSTSGNYYVRATYPGCSAVDTDPVRITVATSPTANFTMPSDACMGQLVLFTNTSSVASGVTPTYNWNFGDGNTSTQQNPTHTYLTSGSFNVTLQVSYSGLCANTSPTKTINVQTAPVPSITNPDGDYTICSGESLVLEVTGSYNSYLWSTGETSPSITVTEGGTYTVEVTTTACTLNASRNVTMETAPAITVTATPPVINEGETTQLHADGLLDYLWTPEASLSDPTIPDPVASPVVTTVYTVTGAAPGGCTATGTVQVEVSGKATVTKLEPKNFFSPNDDAINASWTVGNILEYPQCGVSIYDLKGIKVYEAKPYLNDWDGTFNGKRLPDGVYYYIIRCDGEEDTPRTGSITLLR
ncbi:MAG: FG-GAP-like repeat-containing protein [Cyclobacteriaceae bacterium]|nr:FG-GAP-like repeat-containing protein [Cyclobacteriaceae bacterium]